MIEIREWKPAGGPPVPIYHCTECGAEVRINTLTSSDFKDRPEWHNYDCSIQREIREHKKLVSTFLRMNDDFPLLHFTVIDPKEMGYSDDPKEVQELIDAIVAEINKKLREERG